MRRYGGWHGLGLMTSFKIAASLWLMMICFVTAEEDTASLDSGSSEETSSSEEVFGPQSTLSSNPDSEDRDQPVKFEHLAGTNAHFDCEVDMHLEGIVTWIYQNPKSGNLYILTYNMFSMSHDKRIYLSFKDPNIFRLGIKYVSRKDEGLYTCQVSTTKGPKTPKNVKQVFLKVIDPEVVIKDHNNQTVKVYNDVVGSNVELTCVATHLDIPGDNITWWREGLLVQDGFRYQSSEWFESIESTLVLHHAQQHHSGNYTCSVNNLASASVSVHILDGSVSTEDKHPTVLQE